MKAWSVTGLGEPQEVMHLVDIPTPTPGPTELLVSVRASAANFPDALMCRGLYQVKPDLPFTPGIELCGDVVAVGSAVREFRAGDRVLGKAIIPHGGFAEFAIMDESMTFTAPPGLDDEQAASLYIAYQTGWVALHRRVQLQRDQTLVVHAGAGGVGSAAIQLGKAAGARVIAVVGGEAKAAVAKSLGADVVVDRTTQDFVEIVNTETAERGADVIFDPVGGSTYARSTKCIAFEGSILVIGFAGGEIQAATLNHALIKNYSIVGLHWGLYVTREPTLLQTCHEALCALVDEGSVNPLVSERIALADVADGIQRLADGTTVGRVVYSANAN